MKLTLYVFLFVCFTSIIYAADPTSGNDYTLPAQITTTQDIGPHNTTFTASNGVAVTNNSVLTIRTGRVVFSTGTRVAAGAGLQVKLIPYFPSLAKALRSTVNNQYIDLKVAPVIGYGSSTVSYTWVAYDMNGNQLIGMTINGNGTSLSNNIFAQIDDTSKVYRVIVTATTSDGVYNYQVYYVQPTQLVNFAIKVNQTSTWWMTASCAVLGAERYSHPASGFLIGVGHVPTRDNPLDEVWVGTYDSQGAFSSEIYPAAADIGSVLYIRPFFTLASGVVIYGRVAIVDTTVINTRPLGGGASVSGCTVAPCLNYIQYLVDRSLVDEADVIGPPPRKEDVQAVKSASTSSSHAVLSKITIQAEFDPTTIETLPAAYRLPGSDDAVLNAAHTCLSTIAASLTAIKYDPALYSQLAGINLSIDSVFTNTLYYQINTLNIIAFNNIMNPLNTMMISRGDIRAYCESGHGPIISAVNLATQFNEPAIRTQFNFNNMRPSESGNNRISVNSMRHLVEYDSSDVNIKQIKHYLAISHKPILVDVEYPELNTAHAATNRSGQYVYFQAVNPGNLAYKKSMTIVGYDDNIARSMFNVYARPGRDGAWVLRNNGDAADSLVYVSYDDVYLGNLDYSQPMMFDVKYDNSDYSNTDRLPPYIYQHANFGVNDTFLDVNPLDGNLGGVQGVTLASIFGVRSQNDFANLGDESGEINRILYLTGVRLATRNDNLSLSLSVRTSNEMNPIFVSPELPYLVNLQPLVKQFSMMGSQTWMLDHELCLPISADNVGCPRYFSILGDVNIQQRLFNVQVGYRPEIQLDGTGRLFVASNPPDALSIFMLNAPNSANVNILTTLGRSFSRYTYGNLQVSPWSDTNGAGWDALLVINQLIDFKAITQELHPHKQILQRIASSQLGITTIHGTKSISRSAFKSMLPNSVVPHAGVSVTLTPPADNPHHDDLLNPATATLIYPEADGNTDASDYDIKIPSKFGQTYYATPFDDFGDFKIWGQTLNFTNNDALPYTLATVSINSIVVNTTTDANGSSQKTAQVNVSFQMSPSSSDHVDDVGVLYLPANSNLTDAVDRHIDNPSKNSVYTLPFNVVSGTNYGYYFPYIIIGNEEIFGDEVYEYFSPAANN